MGGAAGRGSVARAWAWRFVAATLVTACEDPGLPPPAVGSRELPPPVVTSVARGSGMERAGLVPGDRPVAWSRPGCEAQQPVAEGRFSSFLDFAWVRLEEAPRGELCLTVERPGSGAVRLTVPPDDWEVEVEPALPGPLRAELVAARGEPPGGTPDSEAIGRLAERAEASGDEALAALLRYRLLEAGFAGQPGEGTLPSLEGLADASHRAALLVSAGERLALDRRRGAADLLGAAVDLLERLSADGPAMERAKLRLALVRLWAGELETARTMATEVARRVATSAPESALDTSVSAVLATIADRANERETAVDHRRRALEIDLALAPGACPRVGRCPGVPTGCSRAVARARSSLAQALQVVSRFDEAHQQVDQGLQVVRCLGLVDLEARLLRQSSLIYGKRGRLSFALRDGEGALELYRQLGDEANARLIGVTLGIVEAQIGRYKAAEARLRALAAAPGVTPEREADALLLATLADVLIERAEVVTEPADRSVLLDEAEEIYLGLWRVRSAAATPSTALAETASDLALLQIRFERPAPAGVPAARELLGRALSIFEQQANGTLEHADILFVLGELHLHVGELAEALERLREGMAIGLELAPDTFLWEVRFRTLLAEVDLREGRREQALTQLREAAAALDTHAVQLGSAVPSDALAVDDEAEFRARNAGFLPRLGRLLLAAGEAGEAFRVFEHHRSWTYRRRHRAPCRRGECAVPKVPEIAGLLREGDLLLSYSVGEEDVVAFALAPDGRLEWRTLALSGPSLERQVRSIREAIVGSRAAKVSSASSDELLSRLGDDLLGPFAQEIEAARRLVVVPDGPLHFLPFAALHVPSPGREAAGGGGVAEARRYLVQERPVSLVPSASTLAVIAGRPPSSAAPVPELVLADARYPARRDGAAPLEACGRFRWPPLGYSEREARVVAGSVDGSELLTGAEATEQGLRRRAPEARRIHLAVHGCEDRDEPRESALLLAPTGGEAPAPALDGVLHAAEIRGELELDADLVVLSACDTALGRLRAGEGPLALHEAFLLAGARSVVASLWVVPDSPDTVSLMEVFYRRLAEGAAKDVALRDAQVALISQGRSPAAWAVFQLYGSGG